MIVSFKREQGGFQTLRGYLQLASISIKLPYLVLNMWNYLHYNVKFFSIA